MLPEEIPTRHRVLCRIQPRQEPNVSMTLCVAIVTPRIAVHVSDRRVSWWREDALVRTDDARNKAVCWVAGELAVLVSYCGLAELDGKTTDLWLATTLASLGKTPSTLGELLTSRQYRPHSAP